MSDTLDDVDARGTRTMANRFECLVSRRVVPRLRTFEAAERNDDDNAFGRRSFQRIQLAATNNETATERLDGRFDTFAIRSDGARHRRFEFCDVIRRPCLRLFGPVLGEKGRRDDRGQGHEKADAPARMAWDLTSRAP
ncbi:hypothetical protein AR463_13185 [Ralstonia solanacearum]|nr:hypothetical protein AR463_13185 [Ralstonia solanacearum]